MSDILSWNNLLLLGVPVSLVVILYKLFSRKTVRLKEKVVLITGASSGIGEACAHVFHEAGCKLILCSRKREELERVKQELKTKRPYQPEPTVLPLDLENLASLPEKMKQALSIHGNIDVLINNGGITFRGQIVDTTLETDLKLMTVDYFGQVALTKAVLPSMISNGSGHILSVGSVQGKMSIPHRSAYSAAKHASQAFYDCLRAEMAQHNIHVTVVSPGYVRTNLSVNAVKGDGSNYGVQNKTTAEGMAPEFVAQEIFKAVQQQKKDIVLAPLHHKCAILLRTFIPELFIKIMSSRALKSEEPHKKD